MRGKIDWSGLMQAGLKPVALGGLGLIPSQFWALTPLELTLMLGRAPSHSGFDRSALAALMAAYPDEQAPQTQAAAQPEERRSR